MSGMDNVIARMESIKANAPVVRSQMERAAQDAIRDLPGANRAIVTRQPNGVSIQVSGSNATQASKELSKRLRDQSGPIGRSLTHGTL